jgi:glycosyltransferase involved in cell wall biosynthesis
MKIVICTNFAKPFHTGGAERVVQQIAETMVVDYGHECTVFTQHGQAQVNYNGVKIIPIGNISENLFIQLLLKEKPDSILIYGDWFFRLPTIISEIHKINCKITLIPVGFNRMRSNTLVNKKISQSFDIVHSKISIVVHSDFYADAEYCKHKNYQYKVIPNAVDLEEFEKAKKSFRQKYNIQNKKVLLCVSNFFPGKGQEFLFPIMTELKENKKDVCLVFISSTLAFMPGNNKRNELQNLSRKNNLPIMFLNDIPREDVIDAFCDSDIFVFPSQQEVSPLVLLESMAAGLPWIGLNVGNANELHGGLCIDAQSNVDGALIFDDRVQKQFTENIKKLIDDEMLCNAIAEQGKKQILDKHDWKKIKILYKQEICKNDISCNQCI